MASFFGTRCIQPIVIVIALMLSFTVVIYASAFAHSFFDFFSKKMVKFLFRLLRNVMVIRHILMRDVAVGVFRWRYTSMRYYGVASRAATVQLQFINLSIYIQLYSPIGSRNKQNINLTNLTKLLRTSPQFMTMIIQCTDHHHTHSSLQ